jgi:hypothetical protein
MSAHDLLTLAAIICFGAASILAFYKKSPVAGLVCAGVVFLLLAGADLNLGGN